jgi:hypothetical protein
MQAMKAPPTSLNKYIASIVLTQAYQYRLLLDRPTSDLIKGCQLARNLMIQSYGRVHD